MSEATLEIHIPAPILRYGLTQDDVQLRVVEWLVLSLFTEGRISSGRGARLLNISRIEFLALLRARGISYIDYSREELEEEFAAVDEIEQQSNK